MSCHIELQSLADAKDDYLQCRNPTVSDSDPAPYMKPTPSGERSVALDFLRGVAILLVLFSHSPQIRGGYGLASQVYYRILSFGWVGVDLFFVLSGFLIGGLLLKEVTRTGRFDGVRFLIRRGFKIWPQYYALVFFTAAWTYLHHGSFAFLWPNIFNVQNYFIHTPIRLTWSLAVEEHFYLALAFVFWFVAKRSLISVKTFAWNLVGSAALSMGSRLIMLSNHVRWEAVSIETHCRIETLALGVFLAAQFHLNRESFVRVAARRKILVCLLVGAGISWVICPSQTAFYTLSFGYWLYGIAAASAILLICFPREGSLLQRSEGAWVYRAVAWIGTYSYGIYLWQAYFGHGLSLTIGKLCLDHHLGQIAVIASSITYALSAVLLGWISTVTIEKPSLRIRDKIFPNQAGSLALTRKEESKVSEELSRSQDDAKAPVLGI